ncbi:hypothetical protein NDU88_000361, partial [Pleurodeles waltl]
NSSPPTNQHTALLLTAPNDTQHSSPPAWIPNSSPPTNIQHRALLYYLQHQITHNHSTNQHTPLLLTAPNHTHQSSPPARIQNSSPPTNQHTALLLTAPNDTHHSSP